MVGVTDVFVLASKTELLKKLDTADLMQLMKNEGYKVPKTANKKTLINLLEPELTIKQIKEYVQEFEEEEIEREIHIKEKIKKRKSSIRSKTVIQTVTSEKMILDLTDLKIPLDIIKIIAADHRSPILGRGVTLYKNLTPEAITTLHSTFIKKEKDRKGKYLEYRLAQYLSKKHRGKQIKLRDKIVGESGVAHEIDSSAYNNKAEPIAIGEAKSKGGKSQKDDMMKWINISEDLAKSQKGNKLTDAYFISIEGATADALKLLKSKIDKKGRLRILTGGRVFKSLWNDGDLSSASVKIHILEERKGVIQQIFP